HGGRGALASLGFRLAQAGVPAVVAMQGNLSMETARSFTPAFFEELKMDGRLERAMGVARSPLVAQDRPGCWMPVLLTRLHRGRPGGPGAGWGRRRAAAPTAPRSTPSGTAWWATSRPASVRRPSARA